jgi:hypothetical protein
MDVTAAVLSRPSPLTEVTPMGCNRCGRSTSGRLCRDCDREQRQEDRVDADYGWAVDTDEDSDDEVFSDGGNEALGHALNLVQEVSTTLCSTTDRLDAHLSLASAGLVDAGFVDGLRGQRLEEVDHHLAAAAGLTDAESVVVRTRNARQLLRADSGGETA